MRILYVAIDQRVPGTLGGSTHVQAVAEGLAALGYDMHVATQPGGTWPAGAVHWHALGPPLGLPHLRWMRTSAITELARRINADLIMERYYNFGGEGVMAASRLNLPAALEVNAPIIDYPGSMKSRFDRALLVEPMRRWRDAVCRRVGLFIAPTAAILPPWVERRRVLEVEWGADVEHFTPQATGRVPFGRTDDRVLCVFAGSFRSWHGVAQLSAALARLHRQGDNRFGAVFIGDGPERSKAERAARDVPGITFTGALPHSELPAALAAADIGVAPFDPMRHGPLRLEFYWSPLKIFEYMAVGLPVVAPGLPRLKRLVEDQVEGFFYDPRDPRGLDHAITQLADEAIRRRMGAAARERVVRDFSWGTHCAVLARRLRALAWGR